MTALPPITDVVDEIRATLPVPAGWVVDDTCSAPLRHRSTTVYLIAESEERKGDGDGSMQRRDFRIRVELCASPAGEEASQTRDRATSQALARAVEDAATWATTHRTGATWEQIDLAGIAYDTVRTLDFRGAALIFTGYQEV